MDEESSMYTDTGKSNVKNVTCFRKMDQIVQILKIRLFISTFILKSDLHNDAISLGLAVSFSN